MSARRRALDVLAGRTGQHAGYVLRFLLGGFGEDGSEKKAVLEAARAALTESKGLYSAAYERWVSSLDGYSCAKYKSRGRLIVGMGRETVLETGVTLQHTYGVPVLPGTGLKGLCSHYCHTVWGAEDPLYKMGGALYQVLFGDVAGAGVVQFVDAWMDPASIKPGSGLLRDVMTPHHRKWNTDIGKEKLKVVSPPSDADDPLPVAWLSVSGTFLVAYRVDLAADDPQRDAVVRLAGSLIEQALGQWGIGGKTNAGYGRLVRG